MCEGFYHKLGQTIIKSIDDVEAYIIIDELYFIAILQTYEPNSQLLQYININDPYWSNMITQFRVNPPELAKRGINYTLCYTINPQNETDQTWIYWRSDHNSDLIYINSISLQQFQLDKNYVKELNLENIIDINIARVYGCNNIYNDVRNWITLDNLHKFVSSETKTLLLQNEAIKGPFKIKKSLFYYLFFALFISSFLFLKNSIMAELYFA